MKSTRCKIYWMRPERYLNLFVNLHHGQQLAVPVLSFPSGTAVERIVHSIEKNAIGFVLSNPNWPEIPITENVPSYEENGGMDVIFAVQAHCAACGQLKYPGQLHSCSPGKFMEGWAKGFGINNHNEVMVARRDLEKDKAITQQLIDEFSNPNLGEPHKIVTPTEVSFHPVNTIPTEESFDFKTKKADEPVQVHRLPCPNCNEALTITQTLFDCKGCGIGLEFHPNLKAVTRRQ